ncbi:hypothetical protein N2W54_002068 [Lotmaria passim]
MQVLSEAMPMTNGEVYALLRRRRDERNAARHPPFGLQPALSDNHSTQPQPQTALLRAMPSGAASAASGVTGTTNRNNNNNNDNSSSSAHNLSLRGQSVSGRAVPADMLDSVVATAAASTARLLASPSSGHLVVLLTEVTMLNYLANHASFQQQQQQQQQQQGNTTSSPLTVENGEAASASAAAKSDNADTTSTHVVLTQTVRDVYGPTSVYDRGVAEALPGSGMQLLNSTTTTTASTSLDGRRGGFPRLAVDALTDASRVSSCYAALAAHQPGSRGHVRAAAALLDEYEEAGQAQERVYAAGVRHVVQELCRKGLWAPSSRGLPAANTSSKNRDFSNGNAVPAASLVKGEAHEEEAEASRGGSESALYGKHKSGSNGDDALNSAGAEGHKAAALPSLQVKKIQNEASVPLLAEPSPLWGSSAVLRGASHHNMAAGGAAGDTARLNTSISSSSPQQQQQQTRRAALLTESEVMQLVVGRPQRPLDVYRLLDDLDARLEYSEDAINMFVEGVVAVFTAESAAS